MSNYAKDVIALAKSQVGYYGKKSNKDLDDFNVNKGGKYTKYARDFDTKYPTFYNGKKNGFDWCDVFFDWLIVTSFGETVGREMIYQPLKSCGAGCRFSMRYYKENKALFTEPKVGDQIFFGKETNNPTHTGIVVNVDNTYVYTIEGNISSHVGEKKYKLGASNILGYGRPKYDEDVLLPRPPIYWNVVSGKIKTTTTTAALDLRQKVNTQCKVYLVIPKGAKVSVVQEKLITYDGHTWDCVIYKDYIGYVDNKYLK